MTFNWIRLRQPVFHVFFCFIAMVFTQCASSESSEFIIWNGLIIDGSGGYAYRMDMGVKGSKIVAMGKLDTLNAKRVFDATRSVVIPYVNAPKDSKTGTHQDYLKRLLDTLTNKDSIPLTTAVYSVLRSVNTGLPNKGLLTKGYDADFIILEENAMNYNIPFKVPSINRISVLAVIEGGKQVYP